MRRLIMGPNIVTIFITGICLAYGVQAQKPPTLRERAAIANEKALTIPFIDDVSPVSIADLTKGSDLVVEGRLRPVRVYLSPGEQYVYTDYEIVSAQVIVDRESAGRQPGPGGPTIVTLLGGEMVLEGKNVTLIDTTRRSLADGSQFLLFLKRTAEPGRRYTLNRATAGIFEIHGDRSMQAMLRDYTNEEIRGRRAEEVVERIRSMRDK
jgi:hypothetical protein